MFAADAQPRRNLIGLTPLIDVVFILLVFFMLTSSFLQWRAIDLAAPAAAGGGAMKGAMLVHVRADGLRLGAQSLSLDALGERVAARLEEYPEQRVLIRPGKRVPLQDAVTVLDRLTAVGARNISLVGR